jgi:hypothetical protein
LKGKWHFGATFIDNEGKNVIGCIYLMNITGAQDTDHPPFSNFLFTNLFSTLKNQKKSMDKRKPIYMAWPT